MLTLRRPRPSAIDRHLTGQRELALSYDAAEMTRGPAPTGFTADHRRAQLGAGDAVFQRAAIALRSWTMFRQEWIRLYPEGEPPSVGQAVAVVVNVGALYWTNACRVLYLVDEMAPIRRVGFAYGTLPDHAECGEERFWVELSADGSVWYDLLAYSRPRHWLARAAYPWTRLLQRRFAAGSVAAMMREVELRR
jgi:uncharacterized protein (UPF0548 family)